MFLLEMMTILSMVVPRIHISLGKKKWKGTFQKFELYQGRFSMKFWETDNYSDF